MRSEEIDELQALIVSREVRILVSRAATRASSLVGDAVVGGAEVAAVRRGGFVEERAANSVPMAESSA